MTTAAKIPPLDTLTASVDVSGILVAILAVAAVMIGVYLVTFAVTQVRNAISRESQITTVGPIDVDEDMGGAYDAEEFHPDYVDDDEYRIRSSIEE